MKIQEFIETMQEGAISMVDLIAIKKYIPSVKKIRIAKEAMDASVEYDRGFIKFDSYKKNLVFTFAMIEAHTDLRFSADWTDKIQEYDMLCENDLLDAIVCTFKKDYDASLEILDMMCNDLLTDNSIEASVAKLAQSVSENLDMFVGTLSDKLENFDIKKIIPKDLDLNKLQGLLNKFK
jgi:hypothetical protein